MQKLLFNPSGSDDVSNRQIINGNTTNLMDLNRVKYPWATALYKKMLDNFWRPEVVGLGSDAQQYSKLTTDEVKAYNGILSFLVFLDSLQTNNLPNIASWITAPEVCLSLATQTFQEAVHSQSYQYLIESVIPVSGRDKIYDYWREDQFLFERNKYIAGIYQDLLNHQSEDNFVKVLIANYLLEGLYFYNGFSFFYTLASRNLMVQTASMIQYIHRDELTHTVLFQRILSEVLTPGHQDLVYEMAETAVNHEIQWSNHIIGDSVLGISQKTISDYSHYLANMRLRNIGLKPLYAETKNPYLHLEMLAGIEGESKNSVVDNFFESRVTAYQSGLSGFDDL